MDIVLIVVAIYSISSLVLGYLLAKNLKEVMEIKKERKLNEPKKPIIDKQEEQKEREYKEHLDGLMNYDATQAYRRVK